MREKGRERTKREEREMKLEGEREGGRKKYIKRERWREIEGVIRNMGREGEMTM